MTWSGMADKFLFNPFNRLFCGGKCSFTPEMTTHERKIVICDFPMLEYGHETGRTINVILKLIFQRAWLRRSLSESPNPVFLWQDEFQYFVTRRDNFFQQTCRGSRVAVVCLTQNILNLSEELGEAQPGSKTKSFCGNLAIKIAHQQNEPDTATFMADIIGKEYRYLDSFHAGGADTEKAHTSIGGSQQLVHIIEPVEFTRLLKPDAQNPLAQAIVYQSGKPFNATRTERNPRGRNYLSVHFSRET
jgi:type IV secretory pathway TraG/TraD family ATPase VirD4